MKVLCFGSLNIDKVFNVPSVVTRGETISSTGYAEFPGGKGANQSVALARAAAQGVEVLHAGMVGNDGLWLINLLKDNHIDTSPILVSKTETTGLALIQKDATGDNAIVLVPGANGSIPDDHITNSLALCETGDWLLVQNETNHVGHMMTEAKARGMKVAFNPAPCPLDILNYPLDCCDILILNEGEAQMLFDALSQDATLPVEQMLGVFMKVFRDLEGVIITLGEKGASAAYRDVVGSELSVGSGGADAHMVQVPALKGCKPVDTTGAGDTFVGYFLATFASLKQQGVFGAFEKAMRFAAIASGVACETHGAIPSIPHREAVEKRA
ncbi:hypothetical protein HDU98_010296 [Podochytrium sp. JEL0797]|nr:hypothetical protein HDU98_010296 [Podochytrium sp. JEL0797]